MQHFVLQTLLHSNLLTTFFIPFIKRNNANKKVRQWHFNIFFTLISKHWVSKRCVFLYLLAFYWFESNDFQITRQFFYRNVVLINHKTSPKNVLIARSYNKAIALGNPFLLCIQVYFKTSPC